MTTYLIQDSTLTNIGNAIRTKLGTQITYSPTDMPTAIRSIDSGGSLPDEQLVSHYDFTSSTPYYDIVRQRSCDTYGTLAHTEGTGLMLNSRASGIKTFYGLTWSECYKIELKLGDLTFTGGDTSGRKCIISFARTGDGNENASLDWNLANNVFESYSSSGWVTASNSFTLDSLKNKKLIIYFGVYIDSNTLIKYKSSNGRRFIYFDENENPIFGLSGFQSNDYSNISQVGLGATNSNAFMGAVFESLKIYRLNNLENEPT